MSSSQKSCLGVEYWKIKDTECALNGTKIAFKWAIDRVTIYHMHTICVKFTYGESLECATFLEKMCRE